MLWIISPHNSFSSEVVFCMVLFLFVSVVGANLGLRFSVCESNMFPWILCWSCASAGATIFIVCSGIVATAAYAYYKVFFCLFSNHLLLSKTCKGITSSVPEEVFPRKTKQTTNKFNSDVQLL